MILSSSKLAIKYFEHWNSSWLLKCGHGTYKTDLADSKNAINYIAGVLYHHPKISKLPELQIKGS